MTKRMLIDATHSEETRVVVLDGNRLEDFDVETSTKKQIKGNIYLAKVIRVEPSLQAAFVEYGGNRHGFLAFSEIHPDYYQIPVADRMKLLEAEEAAARAEAEAEAAEEAAEEAAAAAATRPAHPITSELDAIEPAFEAAEALQIEEEAEAAPRAQSVAMVREIAIGEEPPTAGATNAGQAETIAEAGETLAGEEEGATEEAGTEEAGTEDMEPEAPETFGGGDASEDNGERRPPARFVRNYKIQEVIHRRQILLVQVVKEERGTKGAALTTYLSLAGRYCVLMPNSPRGGGVSRKITSVADRRRLREVIKEVEMPAGMGLIVRTAGANRPKPEIRRDCEYLLQLWDDIRELTLRSVAPALVYEEANLIKRAIRDGYTRDIEEVLVDGEPAWKAARDFMRMLTPQHAAKVQLWRNHDASLFSKYQVETQLDSMLMPTVQLKSGGYLVINQAEALVAIDVNSGRATRERNIEETALRTNLEAADEAARQLRLRDLAGLIVIDFIDMESRKHNAMVERRMKEALKNDRARIQVGSISHFGLLEMSRQRLRPSIAETSFITCPHCAGTGTVRSVESSAIHVLRAIEDEASRRRSAEINVYLSGAVAMYILNYKRDRLMAIERTHGLQVALLPDDKLVPPQVRIEKVRAYAAGEAPGNGTAPIAMDYASREEAEAEVVVEVKEPVVPSRAPALIADAPPAEGEAAQSEAAKSEESGERRRRRRRRRRGRREDNGENGLQSAMGDAGDSGDDDGDDAEADASAEDTAPEPNATSQELDAMPLPSAEPEPPVSEPELLPGDEGEGNRGRRRGRRGGRGRPVRPVEEATPASGYRGPTPADPYFGQIDALFAVLEPEESAPAIEMAKIEVSAEPVPVDLPLSETQAPALAEAAEVRLEVTAVEVTSVEPAPLAQAEADASQPEPAEKPAKRARAPRARKPKAEAIEAAEVVEAVEAVETIASAPSDEAAAAEPAVPAPKPARRRAPRKVKAAEAQTLLPEAELAAAAPEPAAPEPAAPEPAAPVIKPIVIGDDMPAAEKRRGWWKR